MVCDVKAMVQRYLVSCAVMLKVHAVRENSLMSTIKVCACTVCGTHDGNNNHQQILETMLHDGRCTKPIYLKFIYQSKEAILFRKVTFFEN
jgi:hypothetical protein